MIDIGNGKLIAPEFETVFPIMFEQSKNGLLEGIIFMLAIYGVHQWITQNPVNNFVGDLQLAGAISDRCDDDVDQYGTIKV